MYAPVYSATDIRTECDHLRFDFTTGNSNYPINDDGNLRYTRPREHVDVWFRPNVLTGFLSSMFPLQDIFSKASVARTPYGLNPLNPAESALTMPQADFSVNGLRKVG